MTTISSPRNGQIKQIRALRLRKEREQSGTFFIEGVQALTEAVKARATIETLIVAPALLVSERAARLVEQLQRRETPYLNVTPEVFETLAAKDVAQGIGAVVRQRWKPLADVRPEQGECWVALDAIQYPGNLGTILRTGDAAGSKGVILLGTTSDPYDPAAVRASVGAVFTQQLVRAKVAEFATWKRRSGVLVVGTSPAAQHDYRAVPYPGPVVLLMGCERNGLPPALQALCDNVVHIPMRGHADSLNLAVATSLMLYEVFRQRHPVAQAS